MSDLFHTGTAAEQTIAGYRVALGEGGGKLLLGTKDVTSQTNFTADEFAQLSYVAGDTGNSQTLTVIAQTGTLLSDGSLSQEIDSPAVQITADVTGARSINAMNALITKLSTTDPDAAVVSIAQQAAIFVGWSGTTRPTLQTNGNFTAKAGDSYRMSDLFQGGAAAGQTIAGYRVALGDGGGKLFLGTKDVTGWTDFTADEFAQLTCVTGDTGNAQGLTVIARTGTLLPDGSLSQEIDSPAVQIMADVTGTRSINAMNALSTKLSTTDPDAATVSVAQQAAIFVGWSGTTRPTLQTDGNFTAKAGDTYRMTDLFQGNAAAGHTSAGYRVALGGGGGKLFLGTKDVTGQTSFTTDEFAQLTYVAGDSGDSQNLTVVAQTGTPLPDGSLSQEIDSLAVQITASVTGARSINAMNALSTQLAATNRDAAIVSIAQQAGIFTGWAGTTRPILQTDGNFNAKTGDSYRMSDLFQGSAAKGQTIAGYRVALGDGGGTPLLGTKDVTGQTDFTVDEFAQLTYVAGDTGNAQSLTVIARTGTLLPNGSLSREIDSPAVQATASVTGTRSINAMNALSTQLSKTDPDAAAVSIAQQSGIFVGWSGTTRPTLQTDGNFTAKSGDSYRMTDLFQGNPATGQTIAGYRVALGDGGGTLFLGTKDVTGQTDFTADEFAQLTYVTADTGNAQSLTVIARTGTLLPNGSLSGEIDSPAVQITANVTGTRSINAMNALSTQVSSKDPDAAIVGIAQQAGIFTGWTGATRPTVQTALNPDPPLPLSDVQNADGTYRVAGGTPDPSTIDLSSYYSAALGSQVTSGVFTEPGGSLTLALLLLDNEAPGAFRTGGDLSLQQQAIKAYNSTGNL